LNPIVNSEAASEFFKLLGNFQPGWVLAILVGLVVAYQLPLIIRELFVGAGGLLILLRQQGRLVKKKHI
jgi:hypothetical protein